MSKTEPKVGARAVHVVFDLVCSDGHLSYPPSDTGHREESRSMDPAIQADWANREFIEQVSQGIKQIASFLNQFGKS